MAINVDILVARVIECHFHLHLNGDFAVLLQMDHKSKMKSNVRTNGSDVNQSNHFDRKK